MTPVPRARVSEDRARVGEDRGAEDALWPEAQECHSRNIRTSHSGGSNRTSKRRRAWDISRTQKPGVHPRELDATTPSASGEQGAGPAERPGARAETGAGLAEPCGAPAGPAGVWPAHRGDESASLEPWTCDASSRRLQAHTPPFRVPAAAPAPRRVTSGAMRAAEAGSRGGRRGAGPPASPVPFSRPDTVGPGRVSSAPQRS